MSTYHASARHEDGFWVVNVDGVGMTQGRSLDEAKSMAVDLVVAVLDIDRAGVTVELDVGDAS